MTIVYKHFLKEKCHKDKEQTHILLLKLMQI